MVRRIVWAMVIILIFMAAQIGALLDTICAGLTPLGWSPPTPGGTSFFENQRAVMGALPPSHRRTRPVGFSGGDRLALLKIGQLRRKCRREGRPRLAARLVRDKIGMTFEQVLAVEAAQH